MSVLTAEHIKKTYWDSNQELRILQDISFSLEQGDFASISGQSGCGKSTLLHILGLLDKPDSGQVLLNGVAVSPESEQAPYIRNKLIGFVFQFHYLMDDLTTLENVALPLMIAGNSKKESLARAEEMLRELDLQSRHNHYPYQLSGGEQQRAALGRALINQPAIVLADEPTGNLDPGHSQEVLELFHQFNQKLACAFLLVTHDPAIAEKSQTHYRIENGILLTA